VLDLLIIVGMHKREASSMTVSTYEEVLTLVERLSPAEQQQLLAELAARLQQKMGSKHRITEFRGVGQANPIGMDAQAYINQERDSWTG
jgi:hypothetical protein